MVGVKNGMVLAALISSMVFVQLNQGVVQSATTKEPTQQVKTNAQVGPLTQSKNETWHWVSLPLRLATGASGLALGAVQGGVKGVVRTEEALMLTTFGEAEKNALMVPIGLLGTLAAVPVGFASGLPAGATQGGEAGYHFWDRF